MSILHRFFRLIGTGIYIICFIVFWPFIYIIKNNEFHIIFFVLYIVSSGPDIASLVFSSLYLNCDLTNGQKTALGTIMFTSCTTLLRRLLIVFGIYKPCEHSQYLGCEKWFKSIFYLLPTIYTYIANIIFYDKLETCSHLSSRDTLIFILIAGLIGAIVEIDALYNIWDSIVNRNNRHVTARHISPEPRLTQIIVNSNKEIIIHKINSSNFINNDDTTCTICLENKDLIELDCKHIYHKECIIEWVNQTMITSKKCPVCRSDI